jgi:polar amino acid transport system substrate-binding protein
MTQKKAIAERSYLGIAVLGAVFTVVVACPAFAETVMQKITRTGILKAGTSTEAVPLAYQDKQGKLVGYSVDMLKLIQAQLEKELGKKIKLELVGLPVEQRLSKVAKREVDIVCGSTSFTWERDKTVDFSISYGVTGTRLLVKKGSQLGEPETLVGKRIGIIPKTTNEHVMKEVQPRATLVPIKNRVDGIAALEQGQIDAFASDGLLLEGIKATARQPNQFDVVPPRPYTREGIACMVPENESKFQNVVNFALIRFMQGFVLGKPNYVAIFDRWFGPQGIIPLNQDLRELTVDYMQSVIDSREQIDPELL